MYEILGKESDKCWKNLNVIMMSAKQVKDMILMWVPVSHQPLRSASYWIGIKPMWQVTGYSAEQLGEETYSKNGTHGMILNQ